MNIIIRGEERRGGMLLACFNSLNLDNGWEMLLRSYKQKQCQEKMDGESQPTHLGLERVHVANEWRSFM
jgi:hypothetical protein